MTSSGHTAASDSRSSSRRFCSYSAMTALRGFMWNFERYGQSLDGFDIDRERCTVAVHGTQTFACLAQYGRVVERSNCGTATDDRDANAPHIDDRLEPN